MTCTTHTTSLICTVLHIMYDIHVTRNLLRPCMAYITCNA